MSERGRTRDIRLSRQAALTTTPELPLRVYLKPRHNQPRAIEVKKKIAEKREGQRHRGTQATNKKPAPARNQRQSERAEQPEQPKKAARGELPDLPLLNLSDNDLTRVALFISAHTILYARAMNAGTMEPDDVPHIASKSVNWAFRANVSPLTIRDYLLHLPKDL